MTGTKPCTPICSSATVGCIHGLRHGYTETGIKLVAFLTYPFPPTWRFGNAKSVLGLWWDIWVANVEIIHYVQGILETYISGAHIQVDQRQSHACNMIVAYGSHCDYGIWGPGYWCAGPTLYACKFVSQRLCMYWRPVWNHSIAANPVNDQTFSTEGSRSCTWCGWFSLGTSNHFVLSV